VFMFAMDSYYGAPPPRNYRHAPYDYPYDYSYDYPFPEDLKWRRLAPHEILPKELTDPCVPSTPEDRYLLAKTEAAYGQVDRVSDSAMLDDARAHEHERLYGTLPPSPRNLYERGTVASDAKANKIDAATELLKNRREEQSRESSKKKYYRGSGQHYQTRHRATPTPKNAALNKKIAEEKSKDSEGETGRSQYMSGPAAKSKMVQESIPPPPPPLPSDAYDAYYHYGATPAMWNPHVAGSYPAYYNHRGHPDGAYDHYSYYGY